MKEPQPLELLFKAITDWMHLTMQVTADVNALKDVVSSLSPEIASALAQRVDAERHRLQQMTDTRLAMLQLLQQNLSKTSH